VRCFLRDYKKKKIQTKNREKKKENKKEEGTPQSANTAGLAGVANYNRTSTNGHLSTTACATATEACPNCRNNNDQLHAINN